MTVLDNDTFLIRLSEVFKAAEPIGRKVSLSMKRYTYDERKLIAKQQKEKTEPSSEAKTVSSDKEYPCLFRAVCGKTKLSTVVTTKDGNKFLNEYHTLLRGFIKMKPKDRKKDKEKKAVRVQKKKATTG